MQDVSPKIQQILQQILSLSDLDSLVLAFKEIYKGKILRPWRPMKKAKMSWYQQSLSCRDGLLNKELIKISSHFKNENRQAGTVLYYTYSFGCRSKELHSVFSEFIKNNEQQILAFPGLQYKAGEKFSSYLKFDSVQAVQDFCDLVLRTNSYHIL